MKFKKIVPMMVLALGISSTVAYAAEDAEQGSGKVTFVGSIIDAPCSISPESSDQEVDLGQIALSQLDGGGTSTPRNFEIKLEKCSLIEEEEDEGGEEGNEDSRRARAALASSVSVTFGGSNASTAPSEKHLFGMTGDASGAGVVITDGSGAIIPVNGTTTAREIIAGNNTLAFSAYVQGMQGATIKTGDFTSVADFTLSYE